MDIDKPGSHGQAACIDLLCTTLGDPRRDLRDASAADGDVSLGSRRSCAVEDSAAADDEIVSRAPAV
jgi:hypothetical protein